MTPDETAEPGLAPERTRLSWRRTLLALTAVAVLSIRLAVRYGVGAGPVLGVAATMLLWLGALMVAHRRGQALAASRVGAARRALALCAAICVGYAVVGAILVLTHLPG